MINGMMATASQSQFKVHFRANDQQFKKLGAALQAGDLPAAKDAFNGISATASKGGASKSSSLAPNLNAIGQALDSGDVTAAQNAFASLQQAAKSHKPHMSPAIANPAPGGDPDGDGDGDGSSPTAMPTPNLNISA